MYERIEPRRRSMLAASAKNSDRPEVASAFPLFCSIDAAAAEIIAAAAGFVGKFVDYVDKPTF